MRNYNETTFLKSILMDTFLTVVIDDKKVTLGEAKRLQKGLEKSLKRLPFKSQERKDLQKQLFDIEDKIDNARLNPALRTLLATTVVFNVVVTTVAIILVLKVASLLFS